jgi:hypothetical protein
MPTVTHGARWLAARIDKNRIDPWVRRQVNKLQTALAKDPWPTVAGLVQGRIARRELLAQRMEAHLLAEPNAEGGKWLVALWTAQRRDLELLALLERQGDPEEQRTTCDRCQRSYPAAEYVHHRCEPEAA